MHESLPPTIYGGRLRAESDEMKRFLGATNAARGKEFNAEVASRLGDRPGWMVRREVKEIRHNGRWAAPPGDIDVLAADPTEENLYVIECKALAVARNPKEMANEMEALSSEGKGTRTAVRQAVRKVDWVTQNLATVAELFGIGITASWSVIPLVVVDHVMLAPYLRDLEVPVRTLDTL